ncbi:MAG TPA: HYR domain-containing protein, partial [Acidobacteriota bacterium]|nr:HYR domain-containing protein [Acidobacteriota bacterium]
SGSFFSVGSTMVTFTSTAGPSCSFTVTVNDTEPPVVTCPTNITVLASSSAGAVVTFTPTASDNCPGVVVTSDPASGSTFPVGTTIVTVTATDASNNTATCTFDVNVEGVERAGIYVADTQNNRCQMSNGFVWGVVPGAPGTVGSGNGQFRLPEAIVANFPGQRIYVADTGNNRIQYTTNGGGTWQNFATLGSGANQVRAPQGLAIDNLGNLYVSDTGNNRVLRFDGGVPGNAVILAAAGSTAGKVNSPRGLAIDLDFNLYVAEFQNNRIQRFANANTASPTASLVATVGSSLSPGQVRAPEGVAVDNAGNLYVADTGNNRIIMFTANAPSTLSTAATLICSSGSALGQVRAPEGVVIGAGEILGGGPTSVAIFISDTGNNRVQGSFLPTGPGSFVLVSTPNNVGSGMGQFRAPSKIR